MALAKTEEQPQQEKRGIIKSMRPKQWTKNLLIFAGLIFSNSLFVEGYFLKVLLGFFVFSFVSGAAYIFNDIQDIEEDQKHPKKSLRPLASGQITVRYAFNAALAVLIGSLLAAYMLSIKFFIVTIIYFGLILAYSLYLKNKVILDVLTISLGFVLRAIAGAVIIDVVISTWLIMCTLLLALFLALCKRRHELVFLGNQALQHRKVLEFYSTTYLDQLISIVTTGTIVTYLLYTINMGESTYLIVTVPLVIYGIFRYLYLVYQKNQGGSPEELLLSDKPLLGCISLWGIIATAIIYFI